MQQTFFQLERRLPENWQVLSQENSITLFYVDANGFYGNGCCPESFELPPERKMLEWLRNNYISSFPTRFRFSDTLKVSMFFDERWSDQMISDKKKQIDSFTTTTKANRQKKKVCHSYYWQSSTSKQLIPFYSEYLNCSVFFERSDYFAGVLELN